MKCSTALCSVIIVLASASASRASTITVSVQVSNSTPTVGSSFTADVYVHVTDNDYAGTTPATALGFANLYVDLLTNGGPSGAAAPMAETGLGGPTGRVVMTWGAGTGDFSKITGLRMDADADADPDTKWFSLSYLGNTPGLSAYSAGTTNMLVATVTYEALAPGTTTLLPQCDEANTRVWNFDGVNFSKVTPGSFLYNGAPVTVIPEPASVFVLALGALVGLRRRRMQ